MARHASESVVVYRAHVVAPRPTRGHVFRTVAEKAPSNATRAKLFANGRSQAVRLPKEFRMPGTEVLIRHDGNRVILEPLPVVTRDANGWPVDFWQQLDALGEGEDFPEVEPMPMRFLNPDEIEPQKAPVPRKRR